MLKDDPKNMILGIRWRKSGVMEGAVWAQPLMTRQEAQAVRRITAAKERGNPKEAEGVVSIQLSEGAGANADHILEILMQHVGNALGSSTRRTEQITTAGDWKAELQPYSDCPTGKIWVKVDTLEQVQAIRQSLHHRCINLGCVVSTIEVRSTMQDAPLGALQGEQASSSSGKERRRRVPRGRASAQSAP